MLKNLYEDTRIALTQQELNAILLTHARYLAYQKDGRRAQLTRANLDGLNLANRNLAEADLSGASLVGANVAGSNLERANLYCADLRNCNLQSAKLESADLRGASVNGAKLSFAKLDHADLRAATMMYIAPGGIPVINRMKDVEGNGPGVDFSNCSLKNASFGNAKLEGANFTGALLQGANFKNAKLVNVTFKNAVLTGVNLKQLDVPPSAMEGCVTDISPEAAAKAESLKEKIEAHQLWITSGAAEGTPANLDGEDLRPLGQLLAGRPLAGLSARNTIAIGVDFSGCQLQAAKFEGSDLRDADFSNADMRGASLRATKLVHAKFDKTNLGRLHLNNGTQLVPDLSEADATSEQFFSTILEDKLSALGLVEVDFD